MVGLLVVGTTPATVGTTVGDGVRVLVGVLVIVGVSDAVNVAVAVNVGDGVYVCVGVCVGVLVGSTFVIVYTAPSSFCEPSQVGSPSTYLSGVAPSAAYEEMSNTAYSVDSDVKS